ncbi:amidase family protein [Alteribacter keqinensis]|uniref:Amidase n=1 Tax=Alteribacter keqinensis TaxID=2483800 RepID=A0A3M7TUP2_9BACI|nr:amidase family protein [Alteribacter keqinensis]RNA69366.1 amidase [Alteribacter keqinensis]
MNSKIYRKLDATDLAELVQKNEVSAVELVKASYDRLLEVNNILNAVVHTRYEKALEDAKKVNPDQGPFSGVPLLVKNLSQAIKGEPLTGSSRLLQSTIAKSDSNLVAKLRNGGSVFLGSTNTPEFGLKNISEPVMYGPTRNPADHRYSAGGSSGGSAAAVAGGIVPVAGASDGGGSIRIPASFTGLVGLKPTRGRTPVGPGAGRQWQGAAIDFVLSRSVRDSAGMLDLLQVVQPEAAFQTPLFQGSYMTELNKGIDKNWRVGFSLCSPVGTPVSEDAKEAVLKTIRWLEEQGVAVEEHAPDIDGTSLMEQYYIMNAGEMAGLIQTFEQSLNRKLVAEDMEIESWILGEAGKKVSAADFTKSLAAWDTAALKTVEYHNKFDYYITPATAFSAPEIGELTHSAESCGSLIENVQSLDYKGQQELIYEMFLPSLTYTPFTQLANLTGQPAISIPVHKTTLGMPVGVQAMAMKGREDKLLRLAGALEQSPLWAQELNK